jgi:hypothetical protein
VLLTWPCLGLGSRVEASFALAPLTGERFLRSPGFEVQLVLNGDESEQPSTASSAAETRDNSNPLVPSDSPHGRILPRDFLAVPYTSQGDSSSSTGPSSSGTGSGQGMAFMLLPVGSSVAQAKLSERLFLANARYWRPPFTSRLFRPPRINSCL